MAVKMISHLLFGLAILCIVLHYSVTAFSSGVFRRISFRRQVLDTLSARPFGVTTAIKAADSDKSKPPEGPDAGLSKYECVSCAYVYDEAKGFKKRIPPGTKFADMPTFACPVCGAAKDQFKRVEQQQ